MTALALRTAEHRERRPGQSERLQQLREEAGEIRRKLEAGVITPEEASSRIRDLTSRHATFLNRIIDL